MTWQEEFESQFKWERRGGTNVRVRTSDNKIIELYTNKYKGNWLIMITGTDKITCGLIGGQQEFIFE